MGDITKKRGPFSFFLQARCVLRAGPLPARKIYINPVVRGLALKLNVTTVIIVAL